MNPDLYCEERAAPVGSDRHYALLGLPQPERSALCALWALEREIREPAEAGRDPTVARAKLGWWQAELDRLGAGAPTHPATQTLAAHLHRRGLDPAPLAEPVEAALTLLDYDAFPDEPALLTWAHRAGSTPTLFAAELLGMADRGATRFAHELGLGMALFERLRAVRADALAGRFFVPEAAMREAGVTHAALHAAQGSAATAALFAAQGERIRAAFDRALGGLPASECARLRPLLVRLRLAEALLAEIAVAGWPLLDQRIELTPLRKLWVAWTTQRRARRRLR